MCHRSRHHTLSDSLMAVHGGMNVCVADRDGNQQCDLAGELGQFVFAIPSSTLLFQLEFKCFLH